MSSWKKRILPALALLLVWLLPLIICARVDASRSTEESELLSALQSFTHPAPEVQLQQNGKGQFIGSVECTDGELFHIDAEVSGNTVSYEGRSDSGRFFSGSFRRPSFEKRYPTLMQGLRAEAFCVGAFGTVYPLLDPFGLRRCLSRRMEILLYCCCVVNLGNAILQAYTFATAWNTV
jgi:hypothetical protein